jgi:DNA-directed RNA polymerase subunit RPC12/RpoP
VGKIIGIILIIAGLAICGVVSLLMRSGISSEQATSSGAILGIGLFGIIPLLVLGGVGVFLFVSGSREAAEMVDVQKKERLLGMIQSAGKVSLGNVAIEMKMSQQQVKDAIFELVNQGLFSGYINWQEGIFYSKDSANVGSNKCPNCGGIREIVGKGMVKCPYCGVELFIPPDAPQTKATPVAPAGS